MTYQNDNTRPTAQRSYTGDAVAMVLATLVSWAALYVIMYAQQSL